MKNERATPDEIESLEKQMNGLLPFEFNSTLDKNIKVMKSSISTYHKGLDENNVEFGLDNESEGTQKMFVLAGPIINILDEGKFLIIDELETHLHPDLCKFILLQFHQNNQNNSQLFFTTYSTSLLDSDFLRNDQIWFVQKSEFGATELYSLADFKEIKNDYIKRYLEGRYGAVPYISTLEKYKDQI